MFRRYFVGLPLLAALTAVPHIAGAQGLRPPVDLRRSAAGPIELAQGVDAAGMMLRIDRLENQVRTLTGQLEQMQFQNRRLEEQMKKFQQDVEFRFQENGGKGAPPAPRPQASPPAPGRRTDRPDGGNLTASLPASPAASPVVASPGDQPPLSPAPATRLGGRRGGDAFDPDANPMAPGAPRPLGSPQSAAPLPLPPPPHRAPLTAGPLGDEDVDPNAPIDLMRRGPQPPLPQPPGPAAVAPVPGPAPVAPPAAGQQVAALPPPATPREEFDRATASLRGGQYEVAETGFRSFLQKHPKSPLVADATFNLGESFFRRQRPREAAEQFLKVSTDYAQSRRAPEALVKLGLSLEKLGAKEQACAAFGEVGRKYPGANASTRSSAEREAKRVQC